MVEKKEYKTPQFETVELVVDETLSLDCWMSAPESC